ncbi:MAG: hypothetical protein HWN79_00655 [Candidatus Lokiarchaeota archaeon]|nr:hypothetical protein [Candidatus Lokiarchaeota archaeon]
MLKKDEEEKIEYFEGETPDRKIYIDWGRQGGVILAYIVIVLGYYAFIANTLLFDEYGFDISYLDMDRTIIFWTYETYFSSMLSPILFVPILIALMVLIIVFSLKDWHSFQILLILIPVFIIFILDLYWNLFNIVNVINTGTLYFTIQAFCIILLFIVCFALTYKEDIPEYGIKASLWMVPLIIALGFFFYAIMFGFAAEPLVLQFGSGQGYINILILILTVLSGSLSGMKIKKEITKRKEI